MRRFIARKKKKPSVRSISGFPWFKSSGKESTDKVECDKDRLPDILWKPHEEFAIQPPFQRFRHGLVISGRIIKVSLSSIFRPTPVAVILGCTSSVFGIGMYEASLLVNPALPDAETFDFAFKYAADNFLPSCIWGVSPPELTAMALNMSPDDALREWHNTAEDASRQIQIISLQTKRSIVAGFMLISQLLGIVTVSLRSAEKYSKHVFEGTEAPLPYINERVLRLAGEGSDVTDVSMSRFPNNILPIYEKPEKIRHLINKWSVGGNFPVVWRIRDGHYGYRHSWARLQLDSTYMLKCATGRSILCVEADATNADEALDFGKQGYDLSIEDASQAFRLVERMAAQNIPRPFRLLRVFLGDSLQECVGGGEHKMTLRDRIHLKKEADVLIDAKAPLLLAILKWCHRTATKHHLLFLDATPEHFNSLKEILQQYGFTVLDHVQMDDEKLAKIVQSMTDKVDESETPITVSDIPRLIYYPTTSSTVNAVYAITASGKADAAKCCALINSPFGLEHLEDLKDQTGQRFEAICAANIYDDYFRQVRVWARMGYTPSQIQHELDVRFEEILKMQYALRKEDTCLSQTPMILQSDITPDVTRRKLADELKSKRPSFLERVRFW